MPTKLELAVLEFVAVFGSAHSALRASRDGEDERLAALVLQHLPMAKAFVDLAGRHPDAFQSLWDARLKETAMVGERSTAPTDDGWSMKTYAKAQDAPSAQLQEACNALHGGVSYFTNVMALGTYATVNDATGEERLQVAVAAKIDRDKPEGTAALARRLREVVADLEAVATSTRQPQS